MAGIYNKRAMRLWRWSVLLLLGTAAAFGGRLSFEEHAVVQESLGRMPARFRAEWLQKRGLDAARYNEYRRPETTGLRLVGKWGRGPSNEVTGRGNLVALTLGSEVALLDFAKPDSPVVLSEIQLNFTPRQTALHDSFLLTCGNGIEIWNIADSTHPVYRNVIPYGVGDFAVYDTFLYFASWGTFYSYSIANAANPRLLGTCQDSGYVTTATRNVAVVRELNDVLGFIDVSNPAAPKRVGTYSNYALAAKARGNICVAEIYWNTLDDHFRFDVLDMSNPANVTRIGSIDSVGGWDVHLSGPFAFVSGYQGIGYEFTIVNIQDSAHPHVVSSCTTPGNNYAVWADWTSNWAYVADMVGLSVIDIANLNSPVFDTTVLAAMLAEDVCVDGSRAYVADDAAGLRILDVSVPELPREVGGLDTSGQAPLMTTAVAKDSFAYVDYATAMNRRFFRTVDVSDPANPHIVGGCNMFNPPEDMVLRDSFVYCAEAYHFEVVDVARPRQPVLVGGCVLQNDIVDLWLKDTLAYVSSYPSYIINVVNSANPFIVGNISSGTNGIAVVRDTYAVATPGFDSIVVYNVSIPSAPYQIVSLTLSGGHQYVDDVELIDDTIAAIGGDYVHLVNVRDPLHPQEICRWNPPSGDAPRLSYVAPYLYAACWAAGVCVLETTAAGVEEPATGCHLRSVITATPSVAINRVRLASSEGNAIHDLRLYDAAGKEVMGVAPGPDWPRAGSVLSVNLAGLPAGVYVFRGIVDGQVTTTKVVKTQRR
jgi:hypothetical protein